MRLGLVYDLRDDYRALGYSDEETAEFDSAETIAALTAALDGAGWDVVPVGRGQDLARRLAAGERFDLVFSIAEGLRGRSREAQVPALCEMFDQPYALSDPLTMAVTLDKAVAKRLVRDHGIATAPFAVVERPDASPPSLPFPVFVKPVAEGTGKGCANASHVRSEAELKREAARLIAAFDQPALVETYLPGREFTVGIVGTGDDARLIAVMEIAVDPNADGGVYSFSIKQDWEPYVGLTLADDAEARRAGETGLAAYRALGCRDAGRVDLRSDANGVPQFLEVNPVAGLHPTHSDLPILAGKAGLSYDWLIGQIVGSACARYGLTPPITRGVAA
ncbi:MAG: D-alanine--D-alanine ligase family protein [Inquilinaceae bacterium]